MITSANIVAYDGYNLIAVSYTHLKFLGVALNFVYDGLKQKALPIGTAVQSEKGRWTYTIPCDKMCIRARMARWSSG